MILIGACWYAESLCHVSLASAKGPRITIGGC